VLLESGPDAARQVAQIGPEASTGADPDAPKSTGSDEQDG